MPRQITLFARPRQPSRKLMHVADAGCNGPGPGLNALFRCERCNHESDWQPVANLTAAKRGIPCPVCNA